MTAMKWFLILNRFTTFGKTNVCYIFNFINCILANLAKQNAN